MNLEAVVDKSRVRLSFSRQAPLYEDKAHLQKDVAKKLISFIRPTSHISHFTALDMGIGTGFAAKEFSGRFPCARIFGCDIARGMLKEAVKTGAVLTEADIESLPYRDKSFDLIFSSLALQWADLNRTLVEAARILKPDGYLYFATFGDKTLRELADSYVRAWRSIGIDGIPKTIRFESPQRVKTLMTYAGFKYVEVRADLIKNCYNSPEALLKSLKAIGAGNPSREYHPSRTLLRETFKLYEERYGDGEGIPATFEVVCARGVKR